MKKGKKSYKFYTILFYKKEIQTIASFFMKYCRIKIKIKNFNHFPETKKQ